MITMVFSQLVEPFHHALEPPLAGGLQVEVAVPALLDEMPGQESSATGNRHKVQRVFFSPDYLPIAVLDPLVLAPPGLPGPR